MVGIITLNIFRKLRIVCGVFGFLVLQACTQTGDSKTSVLESAVEENRVRQEAFKQKQKDAIAKQKKFVEDQQQKHLALLNKGKVKPPKTKTTITKKVKRTSVTANSRGARITINAPWKCVPNGLKAVIYEVSRRYGHVTVNSTHRSRRKNRRIGGARRSYHLKCAAVDFRVRGNTSAVLRYLRRSSQVGGLKRYRSGYFHIDNGPRRSWR